ncbi:uncharacterized protein DC041_0006689 [Schistosoma bovis]|uniref:SWIM-type domain-containing protein n=1 Tax=Schistosoma bovis TaxID=6184 RepID=A0A430PZV0_SCHBO|nr:uncharacterized protein DC041_0006689 [Schistosoma bovis]
MVWAKTTDIGCGVASCPRYGLSIVCNYGPNGNWNNEKPYEVKSRGLCPKMQNIPKDSFQMMRDDTLRAPLSIVNVNHKLSSIGSSEGLVNDQPSTGSQRTLDEKSLEILELHRKYRQDLVDCKVDGQPPAKYMSPLKWNYNLAAQAQKLANKCILQHDKRHSDEFSWVGQNIALHPTIMSGVDAWFNEHKLYDYKENNCMKCLHYTQMVWAKTTDIGCGVASCPRYGLSIVCNYGPGGNWNNEKPYEVKSRGLCPKMQNIPKDSFQMMRDDTLRAPLSIVNVNHKLSSIGSSEGLVNDQPSTGSQRTLDEKSLEILELHRKYRQDLVDCKVDGQPPAKYMSPLKWNYNLAAQAQKLANKCILQHDKRHSDEFSWVGQNIALHPTIKSGVDAWFNEHKLYDYDQNNCMGMFALHTMNVTDVLYCVDCFSGNWNNEKPYEVKSRGLCPKMQNIPKDSFQMMRDDTLRAPLSKVNINHKLSRIVSFGSRVHDQRKYDQAISINAFQYSRRNTQRKWRSGRKALQKRNLTECKFEGQPPAKYLPDLKWDNELASKAKDLANECYFHHNDVNLPHKWEYVGQNIAGYQTIEQAFDAWKDEYKQYSYYSMSCYGVCGHYTQNKRPDIVRRNQEEAQNSTLYILKQYGPTFYLLQDGSKQKYKVQLGDIHTCSCGDFTKNRELCVHLCWILIRRFKVDPNNPVSWQSGLVEREISALLDGQHSATNNVTNLTQPKVLNEEKFDEKPSYNLQRQIGENDICPICQDYLFSQVRLPVTFCRKNCGNSLHIRCMKVWTDYQRKQNPLGKRNFENCLEDKFFVLK